VPLRGTIYIEIKRISSKFEYKKRQMTATFLPFSSLYIIKAFNEKFKNKLI